MNTKTYHGGCFLVLLISESGNSAGFDLECVCVGRQAGLTRAAWGIFFLVIVDIVLIFFVIVIIISIVCVIIAALIIIIIVISTIAVVVVVRIGVICI